jgi:[acyl-carrier-protein] S-malonyltransferase
VTAYLFPGFLDASWSRHELASARPDLYEAACSATGTDPFTRASEDAQFEQPALVALLLARWDSVRDDAPATACLGSSAGELAALAAAGALSSADAVWLAAVRGRLMSAVAAELPLAALALRDTTLFCGRQLATSHELTIASDSAPEEIVLAGRRVLVEAAACSARRLGMRAVLVPAHRAVPSPYFGSARGDWCAALHAAEIRPPRLPVFSCTTVRPVIDVRATLAEGLTAAARIRQTRRALERLGVCRLVSVGAAGELDARAAPGFR